MDSVVKNPANPDEVSFKATKTLFANVASNVIESVPDLKIKSLFASP